jgi:excisionase family DNA binding protein
VELQIISVGEAARILGRCEATVRNWTRRGILRAQRMAGTGQRLYDRADVERIARERRAR